MYQYNRELQDALALQEVLLIALLALCAILFIIIARNWYNLYQKRSFRKKYKQTTLELINKNLELKTQQKFAEDFQSDNYKLRAEVDELLVRFKKQEKDFHKTLLEKAEELDLREQRLKHQRDAYEKSAGFKDVEINNTRLGAHFLKNVISHIYEDLEAERPKQINILGLYIGSKELKNQKIPIKALRNIFNLLDYTVAVLKEDLVTIEEEIKNIEIFIAVIKYLKPKAKIHFINNLQQGRKGALKIKPTLFFPFIENALKHGSLNTENSTITIEVHQLEPAVISYTVENSCETDSSALPAEQTNTSFGLSALKNLLDVYYPQNILKCGLVTENYYSSKLEIHLD